MRAIEEPPPGEALEEHAAEREDVHRRRDLAVAARLLGRDVPGGADERPREREDLLGDARARDAEIDELDVLDPSAGQEQVARLQIAVNEASTMEIGQRVGHVAREHERILDRERPVLQALLRDRSRRATA